MSRPHCPHCRGWLFFTAEDDLPCFRCLMCGRCFVSARASPTGAEAASCLTTPDDQQIVQ
jgi:hypothetical protein